MATVIKIVAPSALDMPSRRPATTRANDPKTMPSRIETVTIPVAQPT
jgi:hypothetical protein